MFNSVEDSPASGVYGPSLEGARAPATKEALIVISHCFLPQCRSDPGGNLTGEGHFKPVVDNSPSDEILGVRDRDRAKILDRCTSGFCGHESRGAAVTKQESSQKSLEIR